MSCLMASSACDIYHLLIDTDRDTREIIIKILGRHQHILNTIIDHPEEETVKFWLVKAACLTHLKFISKCIFNYTIKLYWPSSYIVIMHYGIFNTPKGCLNILKFIYIVSLHCWILSPLTLTTWSETMQWKSSN